MIQKTKNVAPEKFLDCHFGTGEALDARMRGCLNITLAQKRHSVIFQISAGKSFQAWQKSFCTFLYNLGGCNLKKIMWQNFYIHSLSARNLFCQASNVMLRQPCVQASLAQKWWGLGVFLFQKLFKGYIFWFFVVWVTQLVAPWLDCPSWHSLPDFLLFVLLWVLTKYCKYLPWIFSCYHPWY